MPQDLTLLGLGLYSPVEAARLTGVALRSINRWTRGYWFTHRRVRQWSEPVVGLTVARIKTAPVLTFKDLMEVRALSAYREYGLAWRTLRMAALRGREVLNTSHPFSSSRFATDGRSVLCDIVDDAGDRQLFNLVNDQIEFERIVRLFLKDVHYEGADHPQWWSPLGADRKVILHPGRAFGSPIVNPESIRTRILYGAFLAEGSHEAVARWYDVDTKAVVDAVEFEEGLRRAA